MIDGSDLRLYATDDLALLGSLTLEEGARFDGLAKNGNRVAVLVARSDVDGHRLGMRCVMIDP